MAYFAAVISLKQTIERLQANSSHSFILPFDRKIIKFTKEKVKSLLRVLLKLEHKGNNIRSNKVESLRKQIREATYKLQDALDSHVSDQFLSRSKMLGNEDSKLVTFSASDEVLKQEIDNFANIVEKMEEEYSKLIKYSLLEEEEEEEEEEDDDDDDDDDDDYSSSTGFVETETKMVGLFDEFNCIKDEEEEEEEEDDDDDDDDCGINTLRISFVGIKKKMVGLFDDFSRIKENLLKRDSFLFPFALDGMAGIGKTTMAEKIYCDPEVCNHFNCRLWITIGQKYQYRKIMLRLLAQLDYDVDHIQTDGDEKLGHYLYTRLRKRIYLIVLDDVWDGRVINYLKKYLPFDDKRSQVLVTTRLAGVVQDSTIILYETLRFLNEEESWCLLREKVFGERSCPYQLEKAGKKIAKNCDGLPLLIVTVADLLSKAEKTKEYWTKIAEGEDKSIFIEANDKISNILLRSYKVLPQESKACFLYMGVFPSKCEIPVSKLYNLWIAEDISPSVLNAEDRLDNLVSNNIVLKCQDAATGGIKTCSLHSSFWQACVKQSWNEKFLHVVSSFADISKEGVKSQRRLCTYNNVLFGIKEVFDSIESISGARSLICSGPNHQYPVPICFGLRLLKVLDVLSVRFYKFPIEVLNLIHLRYLALTYNGKIPPSISKLWNLEYLIVYRHLSIKFRGDWSYLPMEIWNLQKLRHLQVMGSCLPYLCDALLPELLKLSGISAHNCTKEIFKRIPKLEKLGIQIELAPNSEAIEPLSCFDDLSQLEQLHSLKCVIVNPNPNRPQLVAPPASFTTFPSYLKKLSLSGFGYPWNYMRVIGRLPNLRVLKLRSYAFRGPQWEVQTDELCKLRYLLLEDLDLVHMAFHGFRGFQNKCKLIIKHCYKFKTIFGSRWFVIEVDDCPLIADSLGSSNIVRIHSSWEDGELKA